MSKLSGSSNVMKGIMNARRSCKRFRTKEVIGPAILQDVLQCALRSPSSFNLQPTQIIMVQSEKMKNQLADQAMLGPGNQYRVRDCSALAVFLSDFEASKRIQRIYELEKDRGKRHPTYLATFPLSSTFMLGEGHAATLLKQLTSATISNFNLQPMPQIESIESWSYKNTALVVQSYILGATAHNLATTVMEGFDSLRMKKILRIPDRYGIPMVVATGFDYEDDDKSNRTPRLDLNEVVFSETFGNLF